jgi:hypothetical protein
MQIIASSLIRVPRSSSYFDEFFAKTLEKLIEKFHVNTLTSMHACVCGDDVDVQFFE